MKFDRILSMLGSGWAILPETLAALAQALDVVMAGGTPDVAAFAARGAAESGEELPYDLHGGVAVIPVVGTLVKRNSWLSCFSTYAEVREALAQALDDPRSSAILLQIESPGGTVDGCQELAEFEAQAPQQDASAAVTAETARVVALAGHVFGPEAADKLGRVAASGVTAEQMAAVAGAIAAAPAAGQAGPAASDTKSRMLAAIQAAAPDPVDPARQASADTEKRDKLKAAMADGMKGVS